MSKNRNEWQNDSEAEGKVATKVQFPPKTQLPVFYFGERQK